MRFQNIYQYKSVYSSTGHIQGFTQMKKMSCVNYFLLFVMKVSKSTKA